MLLTSSLQLLRPPVWGPHFENLCPKPQRRQWHPTPVLLPGKSHGWRSLVDCSPWGLEESDTTERLPFHFSLSCVGEGNGNPLQCSCLENPRDGGAWWAAVYGVAQSRTRLKQLGGGSSTSPKPKKQKVPLKALHFYANILSLFSTRRRKAYPAHDAEGKKE